MSNIKIGILGGMGPRATVDFQNRLFSRFSGAEQGIPTIISVNNSSIPDRSSFIVSSTTDPLPELIYSSQILRMAKVDVVCMPCNTAHNPKILSRLMAVAPLPIIDMPAACILVSESLGLNRVLILGTAGTADSRLFNARSLTTNCIYPDRKIQELISGIISKIKTGGNISSKQSTRLIKYVNLISPDAVILACTELSLLPKKLFSQFTVIDSLDVLVEQCVNISNNLNNMEAQK
jgi:aspartate racemase